MAVQVEDHPLAYNCFEGQIPEGQYGAGKVIIWDGGYWVPLGDPKKAYKAGKLKFELHGQKLHGRWTLVRMHGHEKERQPPWLLIKEADEMARDHAEFNVVQALPDSVAHEVKTAAEPTSAAPQASSDIREGGEDLPQTVSPQLAELYDSPPQASNDWAWELKFDGYRLLARRQGREVSLLTRTLFLTFCSMPMVICARCRGAIGENDW